MKKILSLVLAVMMLLGCMSITAFADGFYLEVGGVEVTTEGELDHTTFPAITAGTVTYTAAEHNNGTAKLTLDNATIIAPTGNFNGIYANNGDLVIELIGDNTVQAKNEGGNGICIFRNGTFTGNGSLTVTASTMSAIYTENLCTFSMHGPLTAISSGWAGFETSGGIFVSDGAGDIVAHGSSGSAAIIMWDGEITGYKRVLGSADAEEEDPANMLPITFAYYNNMDRTVPKVGDSDVSALSVVMYSYPATSGTTDIKAVKAAPLSYELVIPQSVPTITAAGVTKIGAPSVEDVTGATEKTVISYTASGTNFKLSTDESKTMTATYYSAYTDASTNTVLDSTKAIEVYKNSAVIASPTSLYVGVAETDWDAADAGTYHATVTFNFSAEEKEPECEVVVLRTGSLYHVERADDSGVYVVTYTAISDDGFDEVYNVGIGFNYTGEYKTMFEDAVGADYAVGDFYHSVNGEFVKCITPEKHGIFGNGYYITSNIPGFGPVPACVHAGATYAVYDGILSIHYNGKSQEVIGTKYNWSLNDVPLSDGATGTINDGDAFVGTSLPD